MSKREETLSPGNKMGTFHFCFNFDPAKEKKKKLARRGQFSSFLFTKLLFPFLNGLSCSPRKDKLDINYSIICYRGVPESAMENHCIIMHGLSGSTWEWYVLPRESWVGSSTGT